MRRVFKNRSTTFSASRGSWVVYRMQGLPEQLNGEAGLLQRGKQPRPLEDGNWVCDDPSCTNVNYPRRTEVPHFASVIYFSSICCRILLKMKNSSLVLSFSVFVPLTSPTLFCWTTVPGHLVKFHKVLLFTLVTELK